MFSATRNESWARIPEVLCVGVEWMEGRGAIRIRCFGVDLPWKIAEKWTEVLKICVIPLLKGDEKIEMISSEHLFQFRNIIKDNLVVEFTSLEKLK